MENIDQMGTGLGYAQGDDGSSTKSAVYEKNIEPLRRNATKLTMNSELTSI